MQVELTKTVIPVGVAVLVAWTVATIVYNAGGKVSATDKELLNSSQQITELSHVVREDHDSIVELHTRLQTLKEYIESVENNKDVTVHYAADPPKGGK